MLLTGMTAVTAPALEMMAHPPLWSLRTPLLERASLSIPDTLFLFVVALVVFGPKRLPEIGKQIGKLVFEFRRASNDFKLQIEEELRVSDQQEKQKKLEMQAAAAAVHQPAHAEPALGQPDAEQAALAVGTVSAPISESSTEAAAAAEAPGLVIQPPSSGDPVEAQRPHRFRTDEPAPAPGENTAVQRTEAGLEETVTAAPTEESTTHHG